MQELEALARKLALAYFVQRDYETILEYLSPEFSWIGTGEVEMGKGAAQLRRYFKQERNTYEGAFTIERAWYHTVFSAPEMAVVTALLDVSSDPKSGMVMEMPLRFSAVYRREQGRWLLVHLHNSVAYTEQEKYPFLNPAAAQKNYNLLKKAVVQAKNQDALTGIYNLEGFVQRADELRCGTQQRQYALEKFGINNFRYINRVCGFDTGDAVLCSIAGSLKEFCRTCEACGRVEKDVFALLLAYKGKADLDQRMEKLRQRLLSPEIKRKIGAEISFTAGVYLPADLCAEPMKDMLDKAFIAMESCKGEARKNKLLYYDPAMNEQRFEEERLMRQAPEALEKGEFCLYLQPQLELAEETLAGAEALVRWQRPDGTVLLPDQFIPMFEHNGFILEFDFYMLEVLCRQLRAWLDTGLEVKPISINQSRRHLCSEGYLERFCAMVDRYKVPHECIVFELTESAFVEFGGETMALARQLHQQGFLLAIDDFGTGYASLHSVSRMAADILKIDRSLLENFETNPRSRVILQKVVEMARETQMISVCEGVETPEQKGYLKQLGCDWIQGFLYARPMPAQAFGQNCLKRR